jgi:hypothetical protein
MKNIQLTGVLIMVLLIAGCAKSNPVKTASVKNETVKTVPVKSDNLLNGYEGVNWGDSKDKVLAIYGEDPNYSLDWNVQGKVPHLDMMMLDLKSPIESIKIYFNQDQARQVSVFYNSKGSGSKELFDAITKKYDGYGLVHKDQRSGPVDNGNQGTKTTRNWAGKNTIVNLDYFKNSKKGTFISIGKLTLLSVKFAGQEIKE